MKVLFDSDKNWIYANDCEKIGIEDPEALASCLWDSFVDDMRTIEIERMKIETTPQDIDFPKDKEYQNLSVGNLLAKIDWGKLNVFVDDANELRLEYVKNRVSYKARVHAVSYDEFYCADAQVPLGAYVAKEYDEICAGRSVDLEAASKSALASLRQMPPDAVLMVNEISKRDFRDGKFDWDEAKLCDEYEYVADLLYVYRNFDSLGAVDDLQSIVAVKQERFGDAQENYVCLYGIRVED